MLVVISMSGFIYDGVNQPLIGADTSVINGRAWEWDNTQQAWIKS